MSEQKPRPPVENQTCALCGARAPFGYSAAKGKPVTWYCFAHRPDERGRPQA